MGGLSILMVAWARYTGHSALMTALVLPRKGRLLFATRSVPLQLLRGFLMIAICAAGIAVALTEARRSASGAAPVELP